MQKLSEKKLQNEHINIKNRYVKLKRCKYALLILKTTLLSLSIGLSFLNPLIIIVSSTVPIIDSIMLITNKDKEVSHLKIQKDIINQIIKFNKTIPIFVNHVKINNDKIKGSNFTIYVNNVSNCKNMYLMLVKNNSIV